jgi:hypothetical protein
MMPDANVRDQQPVTMTSDDTSGAAHPTHDVYD